MFELEKGMKFKTIFFDDIYTVTSIEDWIINTENTFFGESDIDWEETAKLNGIDLEYEQNLVTFKNLTGDIDKKEYNPKYDEGKRDYTLIPINELEQVVDVLEYGCKKYSPNAWKCVENGLDRYKKAMLRHMMSYLKGEEFDKESGLSHLSHLATNVLFMMWFENNKEE